jgi:type I restriction enzyme S subunit
MRLQTRSLISVIKEHGGLIQTGPFGSQLHQSEYTDEGIPAVMPKDIKEGRIDETSVARVSKEKAAQLSRHLLKPHSIVFPRRGNISKCAYIEASQAGFLCGTGCIKIEVPSTVILPKFLYYYLGLSHVVEWLERNAVGTTMLNLSAAILGRLPVPELSIDRQRSIVEVLSAYDDLIENNRRRIQLLEEAARLLYKEWFVHLRFPGHEHVTITDGVPEGWEVKTLGDVVELKRGKYITKALAINGDVPVIAGGLKPAYFHHVANVAGPVITISASGANAGFVNLYHEDIWASDCSYIDVESTDFIYYFYLLLESRQRELFGLQRGAAQPHVYPKDLIRLRFVCAPHSIVSVFEDEVSTSFGLVKNLASQNTLLASARDLLLPRLMNGEVVV